jgi:hypothetical protein
MKPSTLLALCFVALWPLTGSGAVDSVSLAEGGQPRAVIVLPDGAGRRSAEQAAADMLTSALQRISGAEFSVLKEADLGGTTVADGRITAATAVLPGGPPAEAFILLGKTRLTAELGLSDEGLGVGGMRVATRGNAVALIGGPAGEGAHVDDGGLRYAVVELLEQFGCRYLWPGELGLVMPRQERLVVPQLDLAHTPKVGRRGLRSSQDQWDEKDAARVLHPLGMTVEEWEIIRSEAARDPVAISWPDWQRLGGEMPNFGHGGAGLKDADWALREHPEWFALQADGTRDQGGIARWRLCKSNPALIEHVAKDIIRRRNEDPSLTLVSLCPNDGGYSSWCLCDACQALDPRNGPPETILRFERAGSSKRVEYPYVSLTDRMVYYWNGIAERVSKAHPDLLFGVSAYSRFNRPPVERRLHPNLVVRYVRNDHEGWQGWQQAGAQRIFWRPNILLINRRHGKLQSIVREIADHMKFFADHGMAMTDISSIRHHWATLGLTYYATARLTWNPHLSAEEIIADYARHGFGAGGPQIEKFFHRVEDLTAAASRGFDEEEGEEADARAGAVAFAELRRLLNEAEAAAQDDEPARARIVFLRHGLNFTDLQNTLDELTRRAEAGEEVDRSRATLLVDLNTLVLRDLMRHHPLAVNVPGLVKESASFARWKAIRGRRVEPSDESMLDLLNDPTHRLTGHEQSIDDMLRSFGLPTGD